MPSNLVRRSAATWLLLAAMLLSTGCGGEASSPQPGVPANVVAVSGDTEATVSWDAVTEANSYNIYWANASAAGTSGTQSTGVTSPYNHTGLTNGAFYYYVVTAVTADGESAPSAEAVARPGVLLATLSFLDPNLATCVSDGAVASGANTVNDLMYLSCIGTNIADLTGIDGLVALDTLTLSGNSITDATPVGNLPLLERLTLANNASLSNVTPLTTLTALTSLNLAGNALTSVPALTNWGGLTDLDLSNNALTVVSAFAGASLPDLVDLDLSGNGTGLTSIAALTPTTLPALKTLDLSGNAIVDGAPATTQTTLTELDLSDNALTAVPPLAGLTALTTLDLSGNAIADAGAFTGASLPALTALDLSDNALVAVPDLSGMGALVTLDLSGNKLADASAFSGVSLPALVTLDLSNNDFASGAPPLTDVSALGSAVNLSALQTLNLSYNAIAVVPDLSGMTALVTVNLQRNRLTDAAALAGLALPNLVTLDLSENLDGNDDPTLLAFPSFSGVSLPSLVLLNLHLNGLPNANFLSGATLPALTTLDLSHQHDHLFIPTFTDAGGFSTASLPLLTTLHLGGNGLTALTPLGGLTALTYLDLSHNLDASAAPALANLSGLQTLVGLTELRLNGNTIVDVTPVIGLPALTTLDLGNNAIVSLAPFSAAGANLAALVSLDLGGNAITTVTGVENLSTVTTLVLSDNSIVDLSAFAPGTNLAALTSLHLNVNAITDVTTLANLTGLITLDLSTQLIEYDVDGVTPISTITTGASITDGVAALNTLVNATLIDLRGQDTVPCVHLSSLQAALPGVVQPTTIIVGVTCTFP